ATRHVVHGQLALFLGESLLILPVPADRDAVPAQDGAFFRREEAVVRLIGPVRAMPQVGGLAVAVANAVEAVEDPPVMRGMDLGIVRPSVGDDAVAARRIEMVKDLIGTDATRGGGLVETLIVVAQDRPLAEKEIRVVAGVIVPDEALGARRRVGR